MRNETLIMIETMLKHHGWIEEYIGLWTHIECDLWIDLNSSIAVVRSDSNSITQTLDIEESTPTQARRFIDALSN